MPHSPVTPRQQFRWSKSGSLSMGSDGFHDALGEGEPVGNLADELAEAWDEDGGEEPGSSFLEGLREGSVEPLSLHDELCSGGQADNDGFYGVQSPATPSRKPIMDDTFHSPTRLTGDVQRRSSQRHNGAGSRCGGSDYKNNCDVGEEEGISPALAKQMAYVEALAQQSLDGDSVSEAGGVISRTALALKDLGAQASIENGVRRIMTAYTTSASHRARQAREIFSLAHSLFLDRHPTIPAEEIDNLIPEMDLLIQYLPLPPGPLQSMGSLVVSTSDLAHSLCSLSDVLQESRQASSAASRRLKNVRDLVMELQAAEEAREEGIRYIERGEWDERIRRREAKQRCGDVVAGFETTCNFWRDRLFGTSAAATPA